MTLINSQELPRTDPVLFYCNKAARMALQCFTDQRPADSSVCGWCSRLALSYMCGQHGEPCSQAGISEAVPIFNAVLPEASSLHTKIEPSNDLIDYRCRFKLWKLWNCSTVCRSFSWISAFLFIPNPVSDRLPVDLISCQMFLRVFLMSNTFPAPCCPDPSSWNVLLPSNSTWAYLFF